LDSIQRWAPASVLHGPVSGNLTDSNLEGVDLINATLNTATLTGANLSSAILAGVSSGGITGTPVALPVQWSLVNGYLVGAGANLTNANLANANRSPAVTRWSQTLADCPGRTHMEPPLTATYGRLTRTDADGPDDTGWGWREFDSRPGHSEAGTFVSRALWVDPDRGLAPLPFPPATARLRPGDPVRPPVHRATAAAS